MEAISSQFMENLSVVLLHIMKNVALNPYLSRIALAYVKSPFLLSSKDKTTTLPLLIPLPLLVVAAEANTLLGLEGRGVEVEDDVV